MTNRFISIRPSLSVLCYLAFVVVGTSSFCVAQSDLDDELFSDLAPLEAEPNPEPPTKPSSEVDRRLQQELGGDDLGQKRGGNKMVELADTMKQVRNRIQRKDLAAETQEMQAGIVKDLDAIIDQLRKQKKQNKSGGSSSQQKQNQQQRSKQSKPQQKPGGKPGDKPSNQPSNDSTTRLGNAEAAEADAESRDQLMQDAWGNLPAALKRQMQSARPEKFLPKYSRLIEEYFKRLSEENDR